MTKEEAINNLNMISVAFVEPVTKEQRKLIDDTFNMAIQALSQKPCDDAVSREAVKELIKSGISTDTYDDVEQVCKWVDALPSVKPQEPKWIPLIERLPEDYQRVLVTVQTAYRKIVRSGTFMQEDTFWIDNGDFWKTTDIEIIAWMPLPEPYKTESEE